MTTISSATSSATTQTTNLAKSSSGDPFGQCSMAHDFFGSQAFGNTIYTSSTPSSTQSGQTQQTQTQQNPEDYEIFTLNENTQNLASYLINEHFIMQQEQAIAQLKKQTPATVQQTNTTQTASSGTTSTTTGTQTAPTAQDFYMATQIANQFSNMNTLSSPYTSYTDRDYFAQTTFNPNGTTGGFNFSV